MIGMPNINQYFKIAMGYPVAKLQAVIRGQDHSIPAIAAMAAFEIKGPLEIAAKAQQAAQQKTPFSIREKLAQEGEEKGGMLPDNLMLAMQQQQQGSLPENTGIGQLPAPNMQTMSAANGGIIAFDDGGYVPGYAGNDLFAHSDVNEDEIAALRDDQVGGGAFTMDTGRNPLRTPAMAKAEEARKLAEADDVRRMQEGRGKAEARSAIVARIKQIEDQWRKDSAAARAANQPRPPFPAEYTQLKEQLKTGQLTQPATSDLKSSQDSAFGSNLIISDKPGETTNTGIPQVMPKRKKVENTGIAKLAKKQEAAPAQTAEEPIVGPQLPAQKPAEQQSLQDIMRSVSRRPEFEAELSKLEGEREKTRQAEEKAFKLRPTYTPYEKYEESLKGEETKAVTDKKDALQMALVNAGLAIAGGSSRYALQNIAQGAMTGTKQYTDAMKDLKVAAKERQKAMAFIEEARNAKTDKDADRAQQFLEKHNEAKLAAKERSIKAIMELTGKDEEVAKDIFTNAQSNVSAERRTRYSSDSSLKAALAQAAAQTANAQLGREGLMFQREQAAINQAETLAETALKNWAANNKINLITAQQQDPNYYNQIREYFRQQAFQTHNLPYNAGSSVAAPQDAASEALIKKHLVK